MRSQDKPNSKIAETTAETLLPNKRGELSTFAWMVWSLVLVIIVAVVWLSISKFDIRRLRGRDHYVDQARHAVEAKKWPEALSAIQKVDAEDRGKPEFLRILADYLIGTHSDPSGLAHALERLHGTPQARSTDDLWLARSYLAIGRSTPARAILERLPAGQHETLDYLEILAGLLQSEGRAREAVQVENKLFARFSTEPRIAVRKAARDLKGTFPEIREAAEKTLWGIASKPDEHGLIAIRELTTHSGLTLSQATRLQQLADSQPSLTVIERLNIVSVLLRLDPEHRESILQAAMDRFKGAGGDSLQQLVAWLASEKEFGKILRIVPRDSLVHSVELFPAVAQDLAQREQWTDLMELIEKGKPMPVSNARAAGWRALATHSLHPADTRAARAHLEEAIVEGIAKKDHAALAAALTLAEEWNMLDLALDAILKLAVPDAPNELALLDKAWQLATRLKREPVLAVIAERLAKLRPGSPVFARRNDYLRLLRGESIEVVAGGVAAGPDASDGDLLLQALKAYRMGDMPLASSSLERIRSTADMTPGETAVYAGLLAKVRGETARAYQLAEKVRQELLLDEELAFLSMAL